MGGKGGARYAGLATIGRAGPEWTGELRVRDDVLTWPLLQRKARCILVGSLSDLFHEKLLTESIDAMHAVMTIAHWHRFLVQTRRAGRLRAYYADPHTPHRIAAAIERMAATVLRELDSSPRARGSGGDAAPVAGTGTRRNWAAGLARVIRREADPGESAIGTARLDPWPLPNLWLGVSVENQDHSGRIGELLQTPAARRWVCFEPLLGPVRPDLVAVDDNGYVDAFSGERFDLDGRGRRLTLGAITLPPLDWVVAGGETGAGARPTQPSWVRDLRDRCAVAGVPFFFKQWGEWAPAPDGNSRQKMARRGRRAAGRLIDGRSWDEMPAETPERTRKRR
jgi:protein gp37